MSEEGTINISIPTDMGLTEKEAMSLINTGYIAKQTYDEIWDLVRPDPESWDYPAQITRYVKQAVDERNQWRSYAAFCQSCAMSGEKPDSFEEFLAHSNQV